MNPILVHRHTFPVRDVIELLLDASPEADRWQMRVEGDELVVDIVGPASTDASIKPETATEAPGQPQEGPGDQTAVEIPPSAQADAPASDEPEVKGGPLAKRAAIACGERGFWTFLGVNDADAAKADVCRRCGVGSRRLLDHDEEAAAIWRAIDGKYRLWLDGHDVSI